MPQQAFMDDPWAEDQQVVVARQPGGDLVDESLQMFEAVRLTGVLRTATAVTNGRIVPDVAGRTMMSRDLRFHSLDTSLIVPKADDDSLRGIYPYDGHRSHVASHPVRAACHGHHRAHAGSASTSSARSA